MKIRRKISYIFTGLTLVVLLSSFTVVYLLNLKYTRDEFFDRLQEKADFTAQKYFEEDELNHQVYQDIIAKNSKSLPEAVELVINVNNPKHVYDTLKGILPNKLIEQLISGKNIKYNSNDRQFVGLYYPDNQGVFIVVVSAVDKFGINKQKNLLEVLFSIFIASIFFVYFMGHFYSMKVLAPIGHILKNIKRIRATNLKLRLVESKDSDELSELIRMLNQMLERLEHSFDLQKNFISNASHELKNPLTAIIGEAEVALSKDRSTEDYVNTLNKISFEANRLNLLTRNLLSLAQADFEINDANCEFIRIDELIYEIKEYLETTKFQNRLKINFEKQITNPLLFNIMGISSLLKIAISNIIDNACKFSGNLIVDVQIKVMENQIVLSITDNGIGIPENEQSNLCQPFYRASNAVSVQGTGIGLSFSEKIFKIHNGVMQIKSTEGKGTTVDIIFTKKGN